MVEVFKTNVVDGKQANQLVLAIQNNFSGYHVNFDLDDCDHILRIENEDDRIDSDLIIKLVQDHGFTAEVLEDIIERSL